MFSVNLPSSYRSRAHRAAPAWRGLLAALLLASLGACSVPGFMSHPIQARGNRVDPDQLAQLVVGTSTQADALALVGSPTARAVFDDNTWLYISELTKPVIGATNSVEDQQAVSLVFDRAGVLRQVETKNASDSRPVELVGRVTPTPGNETSFVQQLLGNVGRFSPGSTAPARNTSNY